MFADLQNIGVRGASIANGVVRIGKRIGSARRRGVGGGRPMGSAGAPRNPICKFAIRWRGAWWIAVHASSTWPRRALFAAAAPRARCARRGGSRAYFCSFLHVLNETMRCCCQIALSVCRSSPCARLYSTRPCFVPRAFYYWKYFEPFIHRQQHSLHYAMLMPIMHFTSLIWIYRSQVSPAIFCIQKSDKRPGSKMYRLCRICSEIFLYSL